MEDIHLIKSKKVDDGLNLNEINVEGYVETANGDQKIEGNNKLLPSILVWFANLTSIRYFLYGGIGYSWYLGSYQWQMYLGTDTITPTILSTTALTSPIGTGLGTAPNTTGGSNTNPSNGVFRILFSATWNPGTVSGTVGEMGLHLRVRNTLQAYQWTVGAGTTETLQLVSRLAVADGAFSSFSINTAAPLTVNWTMQFSFA